MAVANLKVGDIIKVHKDERVPADMVLLQTTEKSGAVFIRTDQLDGPDTLSLHQTNKEVWPFYLPLRLTFGTSNEWHLICPPQT